MANDITLGIKIKLDGQNVDGELRILGEDLRRLSNATRDQGRASQQSAEQNNRLRGSLSGAGSAARDSSRSFSQLASQTFDLSGALRGLLGGLSALALYQFGKGIVATADSMKLLDGRIRVATSSAKDYAAASQELVNISLRTGTSFEANATLFARVNKAMETLGGTASDTTKLTETMAQALRVSGASASETASVVRQMSQALASGLLRGDEFNSIMENGSRLAYALADGLKVNVGELRKMAEGGQLNAGRVIQAIMSQAQAIDAEYKKMPLTVGAALENIKTQYDQYILKADAGSGATAGLAASLNSLAQNFAPVIDSIVTLGKIAVAVFGVQIVGAIGQYVAATTAAIAIERAHAAALTMDLEITVQQTAATLAQAQASQVSAAAELALTESQIAQTQAQIAASVTISRHILLTEQLNVLMAQQTAQTAALGSANAALASAQEAAAAAAAAQSAANTTLLGTLRALLSPMNLLNAGLAVFVGWQFAGILNQFEAVRKAADVVAGSIAHMINMAKYAASVTGAVFTGNIGEIPAIRQQHLQIQQGINESVKESYLGVEPKKTEQAVQQLTQFKAALGGVTDAQKKAAQAADTSAKAESNRQGEIQKTLESIRQETALIGLGDKERQRSIELTQALTKAKGAEVDAITKALEAKWAELDADQRRSDMWSELVKQANDLDKLHDDAAESKRLAAMAQELKLQGLSNDAIKERIDLEKQLASARESNPDLDPKQVEEYVRQRVDAEKSLAQIVDQGSQKTADFMEAAWKRAAENIQDALANMFENLLNGDALDSFEDFFDNIKRSINKIFAQNFSQALQNYFNSPFTVGSGGSGGGFLGGIFDWFKGLFGGGSSGNPFQGNGPLMSYQNGVSSGGMMSSLSNFLGNFFNAGKGGGFSSSSAGGGGSGWAILGALSKLIPGAGGINWKGGQDNKSLKSLIEIKNSITDLVGNFLPIIKLVTPLHNMLLNFAGKLFPNRRPSMLGYLLFGPLGAFLFGKKIPQPEEHTQASYKNGVANINSNQVYDGGNAQNTIDFSGEFGQAVFEIGKQLRMTIGTFWSDFWHKQDRKGNDLFGGWLSDRRGQFFEQPLSRDVPQQKLFEDGILAVLRRNIANQDDLHYRAAIRQSGSLSDLTSRIKRVEKIGLLTGEYTSYRMELDKLNRQFNKAAKFAKQYRFSIEDVEAARQRAINALKNNVLDQFRELAGMGPSLASQLGKLNAQLIALESSARDLKIAEADLVGLREKAIAQAKEQYLSPLTGIGGNLSDQIASLTGVLPQSEDIAPLYDLLAASTDPTEQARYIERIQRAMTQRYNIEIAAINKTAQAVNNLKAFVDGLKLSNLSPLSPEERLREAQGQYGTTLLKAQAGDQTALANLTNVAQAYLQEAQSYYASSPDYAAIFGNVTSTLTALGASLDSGIGADADAAAAAAADQLAQSLQGLKTIVDQILATQGGNFDNQAGGMTGPHPPTANFRELTENQIAKIWQDLPADASKDQVSGAKLQTKHLEAQIKAWLFGGDAEVEKTKAYQELTGAIKDIKTELKNTKKSSPNYGYLKAQLAGLLAQRKALGKVKFKEHGGWTQGPTLVGENGPELINFARPTLVTNNQQTQSIIAGGNDAVVAELQKANEELRALVRLQQAQAQAMLERMERIASNTGSLERKARLAGAA